MKTNLLLLACVILFASCTKETMTMPEPEQSGKLYPVEFTAKLDFTSTDYRLLRASSDTTINYPNDTIVNPNDTIVNPVGSVYYRYLVYSSAGTLIKQMKGQGTKINDNLPLGNYYISIIGSNTADLLSDQYIVPSTNYNYSLSNYPRAYYSTFAFTVDSVVTNTSNVSLERLWGELSVDILDRATCYIPESVQSLGIITEGSSVQFYLQSKKGQFRSITENITVKTVPQFRNEIYPKCLASYPTSGNVKVYLHVTYNDGTTENFILLALTKIKPSVQTTLKGNLGNALKDIYEDRSLELSLLDNWNSETVNF